MKKSDLYREWARVLDMCEGTNVRAVNCWKFGKMIFSCKPGFSEDPDAYEFAVAILEDKPVFVGDKLYGKYANTFYTVSKGMIDRGEHEYSNNNYWSWNPPKKTFVLNGEELPCPTKTSDNPLSSAFLIGGQAYHFSNWHDCLKVQAAIHKLLQDATK